MITTRLSILEISTYLSYSSTPLCVPSFHNTKTTWWEQVVTLETYLTEPVFKFIIN